MKKEKSKTKTSYKRWKFTKYSLYAGTYALPLIPSIIILSVNWKEWFGSEHKWSLGIGFTSLLVTVLITILGIAKRDKIIKENISSLFYLAGLLACWAFVLMFLSSIANEFGLMLLYTCFGLLGGASCDQVNKSKVNGELEFYKSLIEENELDDRARKKREKRELAREEAQKEAKRRATE